MKRLSIAESLRDGISEEMERDPSVFCMGEDIGAYGGAFKVTEGLMAKYGADRVIDTPISEAAIIGAAAGAAHMGMKPVCELQFIDFISTGYDMLTNYVATLRLTPITDQDRTFIEWSADFDCAPDKEGELLSNIGGGVFQGGFDALKRAFGG